MNTEQPCCQECGGPQGPRRANAPHQRFCSVKCRKDWNNRRAVRGAELYDWFMAFRYQRKEFPTAMTTVAQIATGWRDEDKTERGGRQSWGDVSKSSR